VTGHSLGDHSVVNGERKDGRIEERNENRGPRDQTVTSNKALFTKNTHLLPSSLLPGGFSEATSLSTSVFLP